MKKIFFQYFPLVHPMFRVRIFPYVWRIVSVFFHFFFCMAVLERIVSKDLMYIVNFFVRKGKVGIRCGLWCRKKSI